MAKTIGVYVCSGCGIGECLDTQKLTAIAAQQRAATVRVSPAFCLEDARLIREDIDQGLVDGVVIAASSGSAGRSSSG
jgi:quinone-modifying oxidoreductase subunit QmoB